MIVLLSRLYYNRDMRREFARYQQKKTDLPGFVLPAFTELERIYSDRTMLYFAEDFLFAFNHPDWSEVSKARKIRIYSSFTTLAKHCSDARFKELRWTIPYGGVPDRNDSALILLDEKQIIGELMNPSDVSRVKRDYAERFGRRDAIIFLILYRYGLTTSELTNIDIESFSADYHLLRIDGKNERVLEIGDDLAEEIREYVKWERSIPYGLNDALFVSRWFVRLTPSAVQRIIRGIQPDLNPRALRKSLALRIYLDEGIPAVKDFFGFGGNQAVVNLIGKNLLIDPREN